MKLSNLFKSNKYLKYIAIVGFALLLVWGITTNDKIQAPEIIETKYIIGKGENNIWKDVVPGKTTISEAISTVGGLIDSKNINTKTQEYKLDYIGEGLPVEAYTEKGDIVKAIRIPEVYPTLKSLDTQIAELDLGQPDIEKYVLGEHSDKVYVFLEEGIAYEANEHSREIHRYFFFEPISADEFNNEWKFRYSTEHTPQN